MPRVTVQKTEQPVPNLKELRETIPPHCFEPSVFRSMQYVVRDFCFMGLMFYAGFQLTQAEPSSLRTFLWIIYGFCQGLVFTGVWILAHECGHDSFSKHLKFNAAMGYILHSVILVPYFSWKFSHARHHRYANHMEKDTVFVPPRKHEFRKTLWTGEFLGHAEDAPIVSMILLLAHQLLGWPVYLLLNAGAGARSMANKDRLSSSRQSHLDPGADIFTSREHPYVLLSNIGLITVSAVLWQVSKIVGGWNIFLLYVVPYLWMNHWLVAITFLHHTHPDLPRYEDSAWTFQKGALATVDRDFGFIGRHIFHGIIEYHVIHHMFPRIPFYYAEEATEAIKPLLGKAYVQKKSSFIYDLWTTFRKCSYVEEHVKLPGMVHWAAAGTKA